MTRSAQTQSCHPMFLSAPSGVEFNRLRKRLLRLTREALDRFSMLEQQCSNGEQAGKQEPPNAPEPMPEPLPEPRKVPRRPKWLIGLSGGKDSYGLIALLLDLQWRGLLPVELLACNLDQGQPGFPKHILPDWLDKNGIAHRIEYQDTYSVVKEKVPENATYCALCSRLRRGNLYRIAREEGCDALVLGHHREDILETFFLNLFHGGKLATMAPRLVNDEGDVMVLRPLSLCAEADLEKFAAAMNFPIIPCDLCGSQDGLQRNMMKQMLLDIETRMPGRKDVMIRALGNVNPDHLLDSSLFDFSQLSRNATPQSAG